MKKNRMMRLASGLLVAVLVTTSMISGTFAKYTTSATGSDTARVAKFGVVINANGETFEKSYNGVEANWTSSATVANASAKLVAPGTSGEMAKMTLTGTPEVAVRVAYEVTTFELSDWTLYNGTTEYCPLVFNVNSTEYKINGTTIKTVDELERAVKTAVAGYTKEYAPGTDLSADGQKAHSLAISWSWAFNGDSEMDTVLGNKAAGINEDGTAEDYTAPAIKFTVKTTVTQID